MGLVQGALELEAAQRVFVQVHDGLISRLYAQLAPVLGKCNGTATLA